MSADIGQHMQYDGIPDISVTLPWVFCLTQAGASWLTLKKHELSSYMEGGTTEQYHTGMKQDKGQGTVYSDGFRDQAKIQLRDKTRQDCKAKVLL